MALSIRNPRAEKLAREVAAESGENLTEAIIHALEERLERLKGTPLGSGCSRGDHEDIPSLQGPAGKGSTQCGRNPGL